MTTIVELLELSIQDLAILFRITLPCASKGTN